jgi:cyclic beta-1,2-glucan synthetase
MESAREHLVHEDERLVLLFTPPFDSADLNPGYIKGYPPGVRENGGQYTHAALWLALATARLGDGDGAASLLRILNPIEHAREPQDVARYQVEPYVVAADVYRLPGHVGQGGWTWYTGSAAWMYRVWIEEVFGLKVSGNQLTIQPVVDSAWDALSITYRHGKAVYEITIENPEAATHGVAWIEVDGRRLDGNTLSLEKGLVKHKVRVRLGRTRKD